MELEPWSKALPEVGRASLWLFSYMRLKGRPGNPPIRLMRAQSIVFGLSVLMILVVLSALVGGEVPDDLPMWPIWLWVAALVGFSAGFLVLRRIRDRAVTEAITAQEAVVHYKGRLFLQIAFGQAPALVALIVFFQSYTLVPYLVNLPISLALIAYGSPRSGDVRRLQERIDERGGTVDLAAALMGVDQRG